MTVHIADHPACSGTGKIPNDDAGQHRQCSWCNGHGWQKANGGAYKSEALAEVGKVNRTARKCHACQGKGYRIVEPDHPCYGGCSDGKIVVEAHVGDVLPPEIDYTDSVPRGTVSQTLAAEWHIVVTAENRGSTWNEAHLGLGALWSTTDYGDTWKSLLLAARNSLIAPLTADGLPHTPSNLTRAINEFREEVRAKLAEDGTQWCKVVDRETRVIIDRIVVLVTRGGYTVMSQPSLDSGNRALLPPTYTADVLNQEV